MSAPTRAGARSSTGSSPLPPPARRATSPRWRDPRLAVGVALVAGSCLLGARLLGAADDTVPVWAVRADIAAGEVVEVADLERQDVSFPSGRLADRYVSAEALPAGVTATHSLAAGELLPRAALGGAQDEEVVEVPLAVPAEAVPAGLRPGAVVDVWVSPDTARSAASPAASTRVLDDVPVLAAPSGSQGLTPTAVRQVVVGLDEESEPGLAAALGRIASGTVVLTVQR